MGAQRVSGTAKKSLRMRILLADAAGLRALAPHEAGYCAALHFEFFGHKVALRQAAYRTKGIGFLRQTLAARDFLEFFVKAQA